MALYELTSEGVRNTVTNQFIPDDIGNREWRIYQSWLDLGNVPDPQPIVTPPTIDEEYDVLSDWMKELIKISGANLVALKAAVVARRNQ
jgi:hypothetical protein